MDHSGLLMFESVKKHNVSEKISNQIRSAIITGKLKPGDKLPSEKELSQQFSVSQGSLREALRSLVALGLLEVRKGARGGAFVTEIDPDKAKEGISNFFAFQGLTLKNLLDVRFVLESHIAETVATVISDEDLRYLGQLLRETEEALRSGTVFNYREKEVEFHLILAKATRNPLLVFLLDFVENILLDAKQILKTDPEFSVKVLQAHNRIYRALLSRNPDEVKNAIIMDIKEVEEALMRMQDDTARLANSDAPLPLVNGDNYRKDQL